MKKILTIFGLSVALSFMLVVLKFMMLPVLMHDANYGIQAVRNEGTVSHLFVGSSMFKMGVNSDVFSDENNNSFNLCFNGAQPWMEYYEIKELIDSDVEIEKIYLDMYSGTLTSEVSLSDIKVIQGVGIGFALRLYNTLRELGNAGLSELYEMIVLSSNEQLLTWPVSYPLINSRYRNGNSVAVTKGANKEYLENNGKLTPNPDVNAIQCEYVQKIKELCDNNGIKLLFIETPKYYTYANDPAYVNVMKFYTSIVGENIRIVLNSGTATNFSPESLTDNVLTYDFDTENANFFSTNVVHLSTEGQQVFSNVLFQTLQYGDTPNNDRTLKNP